MSAERLRAAATLLRERAKAATPGPWHWESDFSEKGDTDTGLALTNDAGVEIVGAYNWHCCDFRMDPTVSDEDAAYISTMNPTVALAVADWLDHDALVMEKYSEHEAVFPRVRRERSLAVAKAILAGGAS